jgi:hypothetical protein
MQSDILSKKWDKNFKKFLSHFFGGAYIAQSKTWQTNKKKHPHLHSSNTFGAVAPL